MRFWSPSKAGLPKTLPAAWAIADKDLTVELRSREGLNSLVPFVATQLIVFGLAFGPDRPTVQRAAPALLWLAVLFATVLALRRMWSIETADQAFEGLALSPVDPAAVYLGKLCFVSVELIILEALSIVGAAVLFDLDIAQNFLLVATAFFLGTIGLAAVGVTFSALVARAEAREALLPLLLLPATIPVLLAGIRVTDLALSGRPESAYSWLGLLAAFSAASAAAGSILFEHLLEE